MLESSIIYIIVRTFPESLILILSGAILLSAKLSARDLLKKGIILGCYVVLIRILPINFGVHTILSMIALGTILFEISENDILQTVISTCQIFISIMLSEGIYVFIISGIFKISTEILLNNRTIEGALITLPSLLITISIVIIFKYINKSINKVIR